MLASLAAASVVAAVGLTGCGTAGVTTIGSVEFSRPLAIPPLAESTVVDGVRTFSLTAQEGVSSFRDGAGTPTWGFDGAYLGPTLVAERGERVAVEVQNALPEPTTVHWHGMHLPAEMDGGPHQVVEPGATWTPSWTIDQPAATLWYHPHLHGETEEHVANGLAGMFLLRDTEETALDLPRDYGVDDIPVIVQDVRFEDDGRFDRGPQSFVGTLGDELLVNGTLAPYLDVTTEAVRLRLLNASSARIYDFRFDDEREFAVVGSDGGLLAAPASVDSLLLSPGERAEIVVRMSPGERVVLQSTPPDLGGLPVISQGNGGEDSFDVLQLRAAEALAPRPELPAALAALPEPEVSDVSQERFFSLNGTDINDRSMDMTRIDEVVELGATELWTVRNQMAFPHNFHVHDVQFRILDIGGSPPPPHLAGWKDTVYLHPNTDYRLLLTFEDYSDPDTPYMYHCHLLSHEDDGMMGQFVVVAPGERAPATMEPEGSDHEH